MNFRDANSNPCHWQGDLPREAVPAHQQPQPAAQAREQGGEEGQEVQISVPGIPIVIPTSNVEEVFNKLVFTGADLPRRRDLAAHPREVRATRQRNPLDGMNYIH